VFFALEEYSLFVQILLVFNIAMSAIFSIGYSYQVIYLLAPFVLKKREMPAAAPRIYNYAVLIPARNESQVIEQLIASIHRQTYPKENITIFVAADNCSDDTAAIAKNAGARVWERFNKKQVGKGYALDFLFGKIFESYAQSDFDGFFVFDADNLLDENYIAEMNKTFNRGHKIITSYRNSKNYAENWLSAGYALWFLRESKFMNNARMLLGTSCAISGTGFLVSADIVLKNNGWPFFTLTEDIEFSVHNAIAGNRIMYCKAAIFYDEQPVTFRQSWDQRLRWAKGFYQVFGKYGAVLIKTMIKKRSFCAFDMFMTIWPAATFTAVTMLFNLAVIAFSFALGFDASAIGGLFASAVITLYILLFTIASITVATEWKRIHCQAFLKIAYLFAFPVFMLTYIPIAMAALFRRVEWKPIAHNAVKTLEEVRRGI